MSLRHTVMPGECISSIAFTYGLFPDTLWNHPTNAALKALRKNPNVLAVGDVVAIPDLRERVEARPTGARHVFRRRGVPERLRLKFLRNDEPRAGEPYTLTIDGVVLTGKTDGEGGIDQALSPVARSASIRLGDDEYTIDLRHLPPVDGEAGQRARLSNLGFLTASAPADEASLASALSAFQHHQRLNESGAPDAATLAALVAAHGS